jgi:SAM-dependent methyltransferase
MSIPRIRHLLTQARLMTRSRPALNRILRSVDMRAFDEIRRRYQHENPPPGCGKYLDIRTWMGLRVCDVYRLGLHHAPARNVLDLGTGCGYFPYACKHFGHNTYSVDIAEEEMFNAVTRLLNVTRTIHRINALEPLPRFPVRFDVVTAFMVCFNNHLESTLWGVEQWRFFLGDVARNHLTDNGRILLVFNVEKDGRHFSDDLRRFFVESGAAVRYSAVDFRDVGLLRRGFTAA